MNTFTASHEIREWGNYNFISDIFETQKSASLVHTCETKI